MAAPARSAAVLLPARPRDGGPGTFCSRSAPCPPRGWWLRHVMLPFCSQPTQRMAVPARYAAFLFPARPENSGPGTFCGFSAPCPPRGWWPQHVLRPFCSLPAWRMAVLAHSAAFLIPARPKNGGHGTFRQQSFLPLAHSLRRRPFHNFLTSSQIANSEDKLPKTHHSSSKKAISEDKLPKIRLTPLILSYSHPLFLFSISQSLSPTIHLPFPSVHPFFGQGVEKVPGPCPAMCLGRVSEPDWRARSPQKNHILTDFRRICLEVWRDCAMFGA